MLSWVCLNFWNYYFVFLDYHIGLYENNPSDNCACKLHTHSLNKQMILGFQIDLHKLPHSSSRFINVWKMLIYMCIYTLLRPNYSLIRKLEVGVCCDHWLDNFIHYCIHYQTRSQVCQDASLHTLCWSPHGVRVYIRYYICHHTRWWTCYMA